MITHTNELVKIPIVIQKRKLLNGPNKGQTKEVKVYCKYLEDVIHYKRFYTVINGPDDYHYEVVDARIEVQHLKPIEKTYEEGVL
jgi:hypothetical protein